MMKKTIGATFCALMICSLLVLLTVGTTMAYDPSYTRKDWPTQVPPTIDGAWTSEDEWTDGEETTSGDALAFRSTWDYVFTDVFVVYTHFVVEFLTDDTNDAGDTWQMCIDGDADGGATPQPNDFKIEVVGHGDVVVYEGDGTGWVEVTPNEGSIIFAESIIDSPTSSTPHWIAEITISKSGTIPNMAERWAFMLAVFDESNSEAGIQAWPPSDPDVPDDYGYQDYDSNPIPEPLSIVVMMMLSSVSVLVGYNYLVKRKEKKTEA
jgi:hypothetical protein